MSKRKKPRRASKKSTRAERLSEELSQRRGEIADAVLAAGDSASSAMSAAWGERTNFPSIEEQRNQTLGAQKLLYQSLLDKHLPKLGPKDKILEIGSGRGWFLKHIVPDHLKDRWVELDVSELALKKSDAKHRVSGNLILLPFKDASFAAIVDSSTLHIIRPTNHAVVLPELRRVLKPGGKMLSFQDAGPSNKIWAAPQEGERARRGAKADLALAEAMHDRYSKTLARNLKLTGFEIVEKGRIRRQGTFPREERHDHISAVTLNHLSKSGGLEEYMGAPGYIYIDGITGTQETSKPDDKLPPEGHVFEEFGARFIAAKKIEHK